jgi:hypothetical protein
MRHWIFLLLSVLALPALGQGDWDIFGVEEGEAQNTCRLPALYFEAESLTLTPEARPDLDFLAHEMHQHPKMKLRLVAAVPGETAKSRDLARARINVLTHILLLEYDISPTRLLAVYQPEQNSRSAKKQAESQLLRRQVLCQCLWD